jgi:hypothetical protein
VAPVERSDDLVGGDLEGGEQGGDAGADVVVAAAFRDTGHHRQDRLGAVQGLDLRLLVHTQDLGCDMPVATAIDLVDQRVAFFGVSSSVLTMTPLDVHVCHLPRDTGSRLVGQAVQTTFQETPPPGADHLSGDTKPA